MPLFAFKSNNHFVTSSDGAILQVHELTKSSDHLSSIHKSDWKKIATISPGLDDDDDDIDSKDDVDQEVSDGKSYNGLSFLDGQGKIEGEKALTTLAQHLKQLHLLVSPKGYCFQQVSEIGMYSDFGIHYLRLNDLFSWPRHKIDLAMSNVWSRLELKYNLPKHKNPSKPKSNIGGGVSKEKEAKLERLVKEKEEELEKLKEEMEEANEELEKLNEDLEEANKAKEEELQKLAKSKNTGELQRQLKKKDDELKILKKKKDEEEEQMEDTIATKDEELEKIKKEKDEEIRKMLKKKEAELRALKDKKNDDEEKSRRIEELEKEKEEMEVANVARDEELQKLRKGRNDELQKLLREKNHEIRVLEKKKEDEKNDEEAKARKAEGELEEVKDQLSFSVARVAHVNKELEQCQKLSWAILPSTKFVPQSADAREMHLTRRQRCPPEKLSCNPQLSFPHVFNSPKLVDKMYIWSSNNVKLVDEENSTAWPPPPTIDMRVGAGVQDFDKNDWWYVKTTHPEGGLTMLVYYDGKRSQISLYNNSVPLPLPFTKGAVEFTTHTYNFSFFDLPPLGMRLGFTYRP
ncbi:hypothetical protein LINPERHAP2_LOCUS37028 [Linum perenne]